MAAEAENKLRVALERDAAFAEADAQARATSEALVAAHVGHDSKIKSLDQFVKDLTAALIAARTAGREGRV